MTGAHPNVVKQVMRHSSITLTMDTYGHLFPGQEADAVSRLRGMLTVPQESLNATGTDDATANAVNGALQQAQQLGREATRSGASSCDDGDAQTTQTQSPKPLRVADLCDGMRVDALQVKSGAAGTRTQNQQIMSLLL